MTRAQVTGARAAFPRRLDAEVTLRLPEERYSPEAAALVRAHRSELAEWLPWVTEDFSVEEAREFARANLRQYAAGEGFSVQIVYRGRVAGNAGYNSIDWLNRRTEIGYWLAPPFQGRGVMTRTCRFLIGHAFGALGLNRVEILCAVGNLRSCAVPERLGFRREGVLREAEWVRDHFNDLVVYSMLAADWPGAASGTEAGVEGGLTGGETN
ncbi:MAG TPA: GNAT family protein [Pyrinomonadaceae bacterium]|nr:GNAT family protein [Pyrinomonadaceae bacterium]